MTTLLTRYRRAFGAGAAAIALLGGGIGIGVALTGGAAAATGAAGHSGRHPCAAAPGRQASTVRPATARCRGRLRDLFLRGGIHGEVTLKARSGYATIAFERGRVTAAGDGALTVRAADGTTWAWQLVKDSVVRERGSKVAASTLRAGEQVLVAGPVIGGSHQVRLVRIRPAS